MFEVLGLFLFLAGFVVGLGAVTVVDLMGFLGRRSGYWTEATIRAHKVTKPLIWLGMVLAVVGGVLTYLHEPLVGIPLLHVCIAAVLVVNGAYLSLVVSPELLARERMGKASHMLPGSLQRKIIVSLIVSDVGWWTGLLLLVVYLVDGLPG